MSGASITADRRIAFVCGQASSPSKPACGCRALPDVNRPRERRIRNAQSPKSLNQTLPVIKGQPQAQSQECLGKYLGVMPPNIKRFGFAHHDKTSGCGWVGRLKALLHQCVCVSCSAGAAMRVLLLVVAIPALLPRSRPLSPTPIQALPAIMANGANHRQCFSNLSNLRVGVLNS